MAKLAASVQTPIAIIKRKSLAITHRHANAAGVLTTLSHRYMPLPRGDERSIPSMVIGFKARKSSFQKGQSGDGRRA
jgi:hypothetical protein